MTAMRVGKRYIHAFKENLNVAGLTTAAALSAAMLNPLPLLVGLVVEAAYLLFVPDSKWYEARLSRRYDAEVENRRKQLIARVAPTLRQDMQERFTRLEAMRRQIDAQAVDDQTWFREVLRKLDYLLEKFLMFASKESQFRNYLHSVQQEIRAGKPRTKKIGANFETKPLQRRAQVAPRDEVIRKESAISAEEAAMDSDDRWVIGTVDEIESYYDSEIENLEKAREQGQDADTQAILDKRMEVIKRRKEFVGKMEKILSNLNHQLRLVEDTFGLINDEMRARSPEQLLIDIEEVVGQTDDMAQLLEEIAPYERMVARMQ